MTLRVCPDAEGRSRVTMPAALEAHWKSALAPFTVLRWPGPPRRPFHSPSSQWGPTDPVQLSETGTETCSEVRCLDKQRGNRLNGRPCSRVQSGCREGSWRGKERGQGMT